MQICVVETNSCTLLIHFLCSSLLQIRADGATLLETGKHTKIALGFLTKAYTLTQANTLKTTNMITKATLWVQAVKYSWQQGLMQRAQSQMSGPSNFKWIHIYCQYHHVVLWSLYHTWHARQLSLAKSENAALDRSWFTPVVTVIPGIYTFATDENDDVFVLHFTCIFHF